MGCARAHALMALEEVSQQKLHVPVKVQPTLAPGHRTALTSEGLGESARLLWQMPASLAPISKRATAVTKCLCRASSQG